jgi:hypothetical protein
MLWSRNQPHAQHYHAVGIVVVHFTLAALIAWPAFRDRTLSYFSPGGTRSAIKDSIEGNCSESDSQA